MRKNLVLYLRSKELENQALEIYKHLIVDEIAQIKIIMRPLTISGMALLGAYDCKIFHKYLYQCQIRKGKGYWENQCEKVLIEREISGPYQLASLFIGKFKSPRAIKSEMPSLPIIYKSSKNVWMTEIIFIE